MRVPNPDPKSFTSSPELATEGETDSSLTLDEKTGVGEGIGVGEIWGLVLKVVDEVELAGEVEVWTGTVEV